MKTLLILFAAFMWCIPAVYGKEYTDTLQQSTIQSNADNEVLEACKEAMNAVFGAGKYVMNAVDSEKNDEGGKDVTATISLFDKQNIILSGGYTKGKRLKFLDFEFPEVATINFDLIDQLADGKISAMLPEGFPLEAGVWVKNLSVAFGQTGYLPENMSAIIASPSSWNLLGAGSFAAEGVEMSLEVANPKAANREISGQVSARASLGNISLDISTLLSNNSANSEIAASIENVNLKNVMDAIVGDNAASFVNLVPKAFTDIDLSLATFAIRPFDKSLNFKGVSSFGSVIFDLEKSGSSQDVLLAIRPPASFKFSSLSAILTPLDEFDMSGSYFIISDKQNIIPATFLDEAADKEVKFKVKSGLNLVTSIGLPEDVSKLLNVNSVTIVGSVPKNFSAVDLYAELGLDMKLGNGAVSFDNVGAGLRLSASDAELRFEGAGSFSPGAGEDRVKIFGGIKLSSFEQSVAFEAGLAALDGNGRAPDKESCREKQAEWTNPFGIPGIGIRSLGFAGGLQAKAPWVSEVGILASVRMGTVANENKHVCGAVAGLVNIANLSESMLVAEVNGLTPIDLIEAFSEDANITGALRDALSTGIESAKLKIVPKETVFMGKTYSPGLHLDSARLKFAGLNGLVGFAIGESGIKAYGEMDPLIIEEGGVTFFAIEGARENDVKSLKGPKVSLGLDANDPHFLLNGSVTILEMQREAFVKIDKNGFEFETSGNILDGALGVTAHIKAGKFTDSSGLYAKVAFENKLQTMVADALIKFIEDASAESQKAYQDAKNIVAQQKGANDFEQAFVDLAGYTVEAFAEMDRGVAVAGAYVVDKLLKDALNIKKMSFEGEVTSMKGTVEVEIDMTIAGTELKEKVKLTLDLSEDAFVSIIKSTIGDEVIEFFGTLDNAVVDGFDALGDELEDAFEDLGGYIVEGATIVGEGIIDGAETVADGFEDLGDEFIKVGEYMEKAFADFGKELEVAFVGSNYAPTISSGGTPHVPYNHTLITVDIDRIKVTDDEGDLGFDDDLELYGSIIIEASNNMVTNAGATPFAFGRSMNNKVSVAEGNSTGVHHKKYFYVPNQQVDNGQGWIHIYSKILEYNSNVESDYMNGAVVINMSEISTNYERSFSAKDTRGNHEYANVYFRVSKGERKGPPPPPPAKEQMIAATRTGNINEMNYLVSKGGNLRVEGIIDEAIKAKVPPNVVKRLAEAGNLLKSEHITLAVSPGLRNTAMAKYIISNGIRPNADALILEVGGGHLDMVRYFMQKKAVPQLQHVQKAIAIDNPEMVKYLLTNSLVQVKTKELNYGVDKNDLGLVNLFIGHGAKSDPATITKAIQKGNIPIITALLNVGEADHTSLVAAANKNDAVLFKVLTDSRVRLTDNLPINTAIDRNNIEIVKLGLDHGGSRTEALIYAVTKSNKKAMEAALDRGATGTPALDFAINKNDIAFYEKLLVAYDADRNLALSKAYVKGNINFGNVALKAGANPDGQIVNASTAGKLDWVNVLLSKGANSQLGLKGAVENQKTRVVDALLSAGAKSNSAHLIHSAATNKNFEIVKMLVTKGGAIAEDGRAIAIANNDVPMVTFLLDNGAEVKGVNLPAGKGWFPMVKLLVDRGADANAGIASSVTNNHTQVAVYLLDKGAKPGKLIMLSALHGNKDITLKLLEKGAKADDGSYNAVHYKHTGIMKILIDAGADASAALLMNAAVDNFQEDMIVLLLEHNGNLTFVDKKGMTYLHRVANKKGENRLVSIFLKQNLKIEAIDQKGRTPLHLAVNHRFKGNVESVRVLIAAGANVNAKTAKGKSVWRLCNNGASKSLLKENGAEK